MLCCFLVLFIQIFLTHCVQGRVSIRSDNFTDSNHVNCGRNYHSNCLIEGIFGNLSTNGSVDVNVNCAIIDDNDNKNVALTKFMNVEKITWNGYCAVNNLKYLGLRMIPNRKAVKMLKIEKFTTTTIEAGTFEGFTQLQMLSLESNFIDYLLSSCFKGLENLLTLQMTENNLKRIDPETMSSLTKLNTLNIIDRTLLMTNHQFTQNQIVDNIAMDIYYIEMDLIERLFNHVRNLSIFLAFNVEDDVRLAGCNVRKHHMRYEMKWMIEYLRIDNVKCGFVMDDIESLKYVELTGIKDSSLRSNEFELKNLRNLKNLSITFSELEEIPNTLFNDNFTELESINLSHNKLMTVNMSYFIQLPKLKVLDLTYNNIHTLHELVHLNTLNIHIHVDYNSLDCEWLATIAVSQHNFTNFIYDENFKFINVNGLPCTLHQQQSMTSTALSLLPSTEHPSVVVHDDDDDDENFSVKPKIFAFIICCAILLGITITYISIYTYNRLLLLKHQPFYHMLRDSLVRPICSARETIASDFKGIIFRNLPPTNYEHPISVNKVDDTEMSELGENIYEEIPQKVVSP